MTELTAASPHQSPFRDGLKKLISSPSGFLSITGVLILTILIVGADFIAPYDPNQIDIQNKFLRPSWTHLLGTDELGRDVFSRALYGGRVALKVALISTFGAFSIGLVVGLVAAWAPRWLDYIIVLIMDTIRSFPVIVVALAAGALFGGGLTAVILILILTSFPFYGRVVRTSALALVNAEYIDSCRTIGASMPRIIFLHIMPNIIGPLLILASMDIPLMIAAEAGLSFIGVGVKPPETSWGIMLDQGYRFLNQSPWLIISAGIPLIVATLTFTYLGEALRDAFDPKLSVGA